MNIDEEFALYLRGAMKPDTDRDWVRRNYSVLLKRYQETGSVKLPTMEARPARFDRYEGLD